ncbi:MAG: hypothetical protein KME60_03190 [Cyanomargarita calcarea GSE-NOS-MK-12-04C]|jgi:predicted transcriptional regulator|uniref:Uncharacterized protein n=1 Tax=Cyanomargarita calcarea GSE-NOS-MK-12-04C TaxID=2839659 RepID=A0A951QL18_9CYAN|nr:hypothetical protein [Cyanomargarita calcarea GSE-NOS-MK-12-04C]
MLSLIEVENQIKSEITVNADGTGKATVRGTAKIVGVSQSAISQSLSSDKLGVSGLSVYLVAKGFEIDKLSLFLASGIPDLAVAAIASYYAMHAGRYCTEIAKMACEVFQAIGVRTWMQKIVGWEVAAITTPNIEADAVMLLEGMTVLAKGIKKATSDIRNDIASSNVIVVSEVREVATNSEERISAKVDAVQAELLNIRQLVEKPTIVEQVKAPRRKSQDQNINIHVPNESRYLELIAIAESSGMSRSQFFYEIIEKAMEVCVNG